MNNKQQSMQSDTAAPAAKSRRFRHGIISAVTIVLVLAGVILINWIAGLLTQKLPAMTADITALRSFELNEQSKNTVKNLKKSVTISFMSDRSSYMDLDPYCKQTVYLAEELAKHSNGKLKINYIDIVKNPTYAKENEEDQLTTTDLVVECGSKRRVLRAADIFRFEAYTDDQGYIAASSAEQEICNAITFAEDERSIRTAVITDHTTVNPSYLIYTLKTEGYEVSEIEIGSQTIPQDTEMLVIMAPTEDYTEDEVQKLSDYMENNEQYGRFLLYLANPKDIKTPNLDDFLAEYNLKIADAYAFEADENNLNLEGQYQGVKAGLFPQIETLSPPDFLSEKDEPVLVGFYTRNVHILGSGEYAVPLLCYSQYSGEQPFEYTEGWNMQDAIDGKAFVLGEGRSGTEEAYSTVIAAGSYTMFDYGLINSGFGNKKYFTRMLAYYNHREINELSLPEKVLTQYDLKLDQQTAVNLGFVAYALIPIIILGVGFGVYIYRKNR